MSQNVELAKVKLRIKKYLNVRPERGYTENECNKAMTELGELLEQYNINLSELDIAEESCVHKFFSVAGHNRSAIDSVVVGVSRFTNTKCWYTRSYAQDAEGKTNFDKPEVRYNYFGLESDVDMAVWLTDTLKQTLDIETEAFKKTDIYINFGGHRRAAFTSFQNGFTNRVYNRLIDLAGEQERAAKKRAEELSEVNKKINETNIEAEEVAFDAPKEAPKPTTVTSLIVVKKNKIEEEFSKKFGFKIGKGTSRGNGGRDYNARQAGARAGDRANLNRPLGGSSQKLLG